MPDLPSHSSIARICRKARRSASPKRVTVALLPDGGFDYAIMEPHERPVFASTHLASVIVTPRLDCDAAASTILTKLKQHPKRTRNDGGAEDDNAEDDNNAFASFISLPVYDGDARVITDCIVPFTPSPSRRALVRRAHRSPFSEQRRLRR